MSFEQPIQTPAAMDPTSKRRRRGRPADDLSPRDLPPETRRLVELLAVRGGVSTQDLYSRFDLHRLGVKYPSFHRHIQRLRRREGLTGRGYVAIRSEAVAALIGDYLAGSWDPRPVAMVLGILARRFGYALTRVDSLDGGQSL